MCDCCPEPFGFVPLEDIQGPLIVYHFDTTELTHFDTEQED